MEPRASQLWLTFDKDDMSWLPEETEAELVTALAELLLEAIDEGDDGSENDESEDHS